MRTEREQAARDALLRELGGLSFEEKQNIAEQLDPEFLDRGLDAMRRQQRRRKWMGAACLAYVLATTAAIGLKLALWTPPLLVVIGVLWALGYYQQYEHLRHRSAVYRVLRTLAADGRPLPGDSDRGGHEAL